MVLVQTSRRQAPSERDCRQWREQYGHADVLTLYDPVNAWQILPEEPYTALSVFVDKGRVITQKFHSDVQPQVEGAIQAALGR